MDYLNCPHCHTNGILVMSDGRCPNCKKTLFNTHETTSVSSENQNGHQVIPEEGQSVQLESSALRDKQSDDFHKCPHCHTNEILVMSDGRCPNCKQMLFDVSKSVSASSEIQIRQTKKPEIDSDSKAVSLTKELPCEVSDNEENQEGSQPIPSQSPNEEQAKQKVSGVDDQKVISGFAFAGAAMFFILNITTGVVPGGFIGGAIGGGLGAVVGMIVNSLRK